MLLQVAVQQTNSKIDTYSQLTPLSLANTRPLITDPHDTREYALIIHQLTSSITLVAGDIIQLNVLQHYIRDNLQAKDITAIATWNTTAAGVATVVNGEVTAVASGTADITATLNEMESNIISITVA